jgi:uncharacterized protein
VAEPPETRRPEEELMNEQERQVISDIFTRLEQAANQPRDPEAERFIADKIRQQPYAPYAMAQTVFVQEQALANLNAQVQQLQAEIEELRSRPQPSGGFLSGLFGGSREAERPQRPMGAPFGQPQGQDGPWSRQPIGAPGMGGQGGPWGGQQGTQPGMGGPPGPFGAQRGGSGFLGTALTTAAGVAGGMVLGNTLMNAFKGSGAEGQGAGADQASLLSGGSEAAGGDANAGITDPMYQNANLDQGGFQEDYGSDGAADFGGDEDWA